MAGHGPVQDDPAIERFNRMREEAYLNFRWTRRTTRTAVLGFVVVPGALYLLASYYRFKFNWLSRKDESILHTSPKTESD